MRLVEAVSGNQNPQAESTLKKKAQVATRHECSAVKHAPLFLHGITSCALPVYAGDLLKGSETRRGLQDRRLRGS